MGEPAVGAIATSQTTFASSQRVLVASARGTLYLAYVKELAGVDQLFVARSSDGGKSWADFPQISAGTANSSNPDLVVDGRGRLRVIWARHLRPELSGTLVDPYQGCGPEEASALGNGVKPDPVSVKKADGDPEDGFGVIRQLFTSSFDGRTWTAQQQLTDGTYNGFPSAAYDSNGTLHMVWYGYDGHSYQVDYETLRKNRWSRPEQISQGYPDSVNPTIAVDSHDNLHVAWYKYSMATRSYQIFYRERSARTQEWSERDQQLSEGLSNAMNVTIAVGPADSVFAAWEGTPRGTGGSAIFVRSRRDGQWGRQLQLTPESLDAMEPSIAVASDGSVSILSESRSNGQIYLSRFAAGRWAQPVQLTREGTNRYPNSRWSYRFNPVRASAIDFVYTQIRPEAHVADPNLNLIHFASVR